MFSSLASFIFGTNTSATTNQDQQRDTREQDQQQQEQRNIDAENTIQVTSLTPSVTGTTATATRPNNINKRGKNRRGKNNRNNPNNKGQGQKQQLSPPPSITKLLTPSDDFDEDLDEDDWFIVEKEDEEKSLPRTDSEEEISIVDVKPKLATTVQTPTASSQRRRHLSNNSHSLYSGPRPQQQRNYLQRSRHNGGVGGRNTGSIAGVGGVASLSPPRSVSGSGNSATAVTLDTAAAALADGGITQSLYVVSTTSGNNNGSGGNNAAAAANNNIGSNVSMEESWFVTPPPCFTSIGPIHMETSPFENLLIEHPSMSVYHSIRSAQEATESFVNLDLGVEESQQHAAEQQQQQADRISAVQQRSAAARLDRVNAAQLKQELMARSTQKCHNKKDRQFLCRGAIKRANKVRDFQSKGNRQRRADMQHCKIISGANNNRKCYF